MNCSKRPVQTGLANPEAVVRALSFVRALAQRGQSPLHAVLGACVEPKAREQYPASGINWIRGEGLGFFYHSHGQMGVRAIEHGHFHLFAQTYGRVDGNGERPYAHLIGVDVDATGKPLRLFTTNLWVTGGIWRSAKFVRCAVLRFAALGLHESAGPERWVGLILSLFPQQVNEVLRRREQRIAPWRNECVIQKRLLDRRVRILSAVPLDFDSEEVS